MRRSLQRPGTAAIPLRQSRQRSAPGYDQDPRPELWSPLDGSEVLARLGSNEAGLTVHEAARRRACDPGMDPGTTGNTLPFRFLSALARPLPLVLLALALVNLLLGQPGSGAIIAVLVIVSTTLSFVQEYRADRAAERLLAMVHTRTRVLRQTAHGPHESRIPLAHVVAGDLVLLSAGDAIPADVRILHARDLFVDESALTGESMPVEKFEAPYHGAGAGCDWPNIAFLGCSVTSGTATAVAIATGSRTSFGHLAAAAAAARELTSFDRGLQRYIWFMLRVMLVMLPLVFLLNGLVKGDWLQSFQFALAVAVGLTPEFLPVVVSINLAKGALAMAERKCIVKRLNAIQNIGAMDLLCTDKTGTLTQNRVLLARHVDCDGHDSPAVAQYAYLNSYHQTGLHNLLDKAVLAYANMHQLVPQPAYRKVDELPFDFQRRRMSVVLARPDGTRLLVCKGAVEEVAAACSHAMRQDGSVALKKQHHVDLVQAAEALNREGFRVIAVAIRDLPAASAVAGVAEERDMLLAGYIAFLDPPKSSAQEALLALRGQGIAVKVLSGDNEAVTRHVARAVGLPESPLLTGAQIAGMDAATLQRQAAAASLFVKLTPQQKTQVIRALQDAGRVVGYLGDGINDASALKAADVGISVDGGADIAKESADIILLRNSLTVLSEGVQEGRRVFANITKYLRMSAGASFGNMLSVLGASALLPFLPMAPPQILLNNLLYDVSQAALATDHVDADLLARPRRWDIADIGRAMLVLGAVSSVFDYATFGLLWYGVHAPEVQFQTGWFIESLLSQTLVVHIIRTRHWPFVQSSPSPSLLAATLIICVCGMWLPASPLAPALGLVPMPGRYWAGLAAILAGYFAMTQVAKRYLR